MPREVFGSAKAVNDEGVLPFSEGLGDPRLSYGRNIHPDERLRTLDRELAESGPARHDLGAAITAASAFSPAARAAATSRQPMPMWGGVSLSYSAGVGSRNTQAWRAYPVAWNSPVPLMGGWSWFFVGPMPLCSWKEAAQLEPRRPVGPAVWSGLRRSLRDIPPIVNNGVDHTLIMALSRVFVRLRNKMISIASRPLGDREAERQCALGTAESLRRMLAEEHGLVYPSNGSGGSNHRPDISGDASASAVSRPALLWGGF